MQRDVLRLALQMMRRRAHFPSLLAGKAEQRTDHTRGAALLRAATARAAHWFALGRP